MSGMEAVAIIGTVAAVVSAFEHGDKLLKKIKDKRAAKRKQLPPSSLEQSLIRGPRAVNDAYSSGVETYGAAFRVEHDRTQTSLHSRLWVLLTYHMQALPTTRLKILSYSCRGRCYGVS